MKFLDLKALVLLSLLYCHAAVAGFYPINGGMINQSSVITSAGGTTTLVVTSNQLQVIEGTTTQTIELPDATLLPLEWWYEIANKSTGDVTVNDDAGNLIATLGPRQVTKIILKTRLTAAGVWNVISYVGVDASGTIPTNAATADALSATPTPCGAGGFVTGIQANGDAICGTPAGGGDVSGPATSTSNALAAWNGTGGDTLQDSGATISAGVITASGFVGPLTGDVTGGVTGNVTGDVSGNAGTASALAANPTDCGSNEFASSIAANGDLTCSSIPNAATTATASAGNSTIVARDGSGNFAAGTITANLTGSVTGNADTATALAANPSDCSSNQFSNAIAANGNLTCAQPNFTDLAGAATSAQLPAPAASTISAMEIDWATLLKTGGVYKKTLASSSSFTFANLVAGCIQVWVTNTASNYTLGWPASVEWPEDAAPTQTVGAKTDVYSLCSDGTTVVGAFLQDYNF